LETLTCSKGHGFQVEFTLVEFTLEDKVIAAIFPCVAEGCTGIVVLKRKPLDKPKA